MVKQLVERAKHDLIMFLGDDTVPLKGFDTESVKEMEKLEWGLVGLNDMATQKATHWLAHKKLLDEIGGEFFHTGYIHCFCDDELRLRAEKLGRYKWAEEARILHFNPIVGRAEMDDDYKRVYAKDVWEHDENLFNERRKIFAF
jgi:GT2 family glycosyltransferase